MDDVDVYYPFNSVFVISKRLKISAVGMPIKKQRIMRSQCMDTNVVLSLYVYTRMTLNNGPCMPKLTCKYGSHGNENQMQQ